MTTTEKVEFGKWIIEKERTGDRQVNRHTSIRTVDIYGDVNVEAADYVLTMAHIGSPAAEAIIRRFREEKSPACTCGHCNTCTDGQLEIDATSRLLGLR